MDLNDLNGPQRRVLRDAILAAFAPEALDELLQLDLNKPPLANIVRPNPFATMAFDLIKLSQQEGWTDQLVATIQAKRRNNSRIKTLFAELRLFDVEGDARLAGASLERTVKERAGIIDFAVWANKFNQLRQRVCRIEDPGVRGKAIGTGFLVGADLVLTNYHVVSEYIAGTRDTAGLGCRFDYAVESSGEQPGVLKALAPAPGWIVDSSPFSKFDTGDQGGLPSLDELDYALLRLATAVGDEPSPTGPGKRGVIQVSTLPPLPEPSDIVLIVQHPKGQPLKVALGAVIKRNANDSRIRYDANTERGSSGSPCFDAKLDLVMLHHGGDPDSERLAQYNQGIPIEKIIAHLAIRPGVPHFWT